MKASGNTAEEDRGGVSAAHSQNPGRDQGGSGSTTSGEAIGDGWLWGTFAHPGSTESME